MAPRRRRKRTLKLSRTGTIASAASLAAACEGYATPVHVPVNDVILPGNTASYDVDGDGHFDLEFDLSAAGVGGEVLAQSRTVPCGPVAQCNSRFHAEPTGTTLADPFDAGDVVWHFSTTIGGVETAAGTRVALTELGATAGPFFNVSTPKFLGFQFYPDSTTAAQHWGWAQLNVNTNSELEVIAFGYEDDPSESITTTVGPPVTSASEVLGQLASVELLSNAPNPFRDQTVIRFDLPREEAVTIRIYDVAGKLVRTLLSSGARGANGVSWDRRSEEGRIVGPGIYLYRLEALGHTSARKMVVLD